MHYRLEGDWPEGAQQRYEEYCCNPPVSRRKKVKAATRRKKRRKKKSREENLKLKRKSELRDLCVAAKALSGTNPTLNKIRLKAGYSRNVITRLTTEGRAELEKVAGVPSGFYTDTAARKALERQQRQDRIRKEAKTMASTGQALSLAEICRRAGASTAYLTFPGNLLLRKEVEQLFNASGSANKERQAS